VTRVRLVGEALLDIDTGFALFRVRYKSLVCRPFINEVLAATVTELNTQGLFAEAGPVLVYVSKSVSHPMFSVEALLHHLLTFDFFLSVCQLGHIMIQRRSLHAFYLIIH